MSEATESWSVDREVELEPEEHAWFAEHDERGALRRDVGIECYIVAMGWDCPETHHMTDLSPFGAFVRSDAPLPVGQGLVVSFTPPRWDREIDVFAQVVRIDEARFRGVSGMAIAFSGVSTSEHFALADALLALEPAAASEAE